MTALDSNKVFALSSWMGTVPPMHAPFKAWLYCPASLRREHTPTKYCHYNMVITGETNLLYHASTSTNTSSF